MSLFKAQATLRELKQRTGLQLSKAVITDEQDSNGYPVLRVVNAGETILIRCHVLPNATTHEDGLGQPQQLYSPHIVELLRDSTAVDAATREKMVAYTSLLGMKFQIYEIDPMPAAGAFTLVGATLIADIKADAINPLVISQ